MLESILLVLVLLIIIYQDFKERLISFWTIPCLFFTALYIAVNNEDWQVFFLTFNLSFVAIQLVGVTLYFSIKHGRLINISKDYLGIGDILFFMTICPLFTPVQFCLFFISSLILILSLAFSYQFLTKKKLETIPLAGAMSSCVLAYFFTLNHYNYSPYNDWFLLELIYG